MIRVIIPFVCVYEGCIWQETGLEWVKGCKECGSKNVLVGEEWIFYSSPSWRLAQDMKDTSVLERVWRERKESCND